MKRSVSLISLTLAAAFTLGSCGQKASDTPNALIDAIVSDAAGAEPNPSAKYVTADSDPNVDLDLTAMNSTMVYSVIYDIMVEPEKYYGQTMKVDGFFDTVTDDRLGTRYFFVVVPDAAACCSQGLEFMLDDSKSYPDDYPETAADIEVKGILDRYDEEGQTYYYIRTDELKVL